MSNSPRGCHSWDVAISTKRIVRFIIMIYFRNSFCCCARPRTETAAPLADRCNSSCWCCVFTAHVLETSNVMFGRGNVLQYCGQVVCNVLRSGRLRGINHRQNVELLI